MSQCSPNSLFRRNLLRLLSSSGRRLVSSRLHWIRQHERQTSSSAVTRSRFKYSFPMFLNCFSNVPFFSHFFAWSCLVSIRLDPVNFISDPTGEKQAEPSIPWCLRGACIMSLIEGHVMAGLFANIIIESWGDVVLRRVVLTVDAGFPTKKAGACRIDAQRRWSQMAVGDHDDRCGVSTSC